MASHGVRAAQFLFVYYVIRSVALLHASHSILFCCCCCWPPKSQYKHRVNNDKKKQNKKKYRKIEEATCTLDHRFGYNNNNNKNNIVVEMCGVMWPKVIIKKINMIAIDAHRAHKVHSQEPSTTTCSNNNNNWKITNPALAMSPWEQNRLSVWCVRCASQ